MSQHPYTEMARREIYRVDEVLAGVDLPWPLGEGERKLLTVLRNHVGKDNAIKREQLAELLHQPDRMVRRLVRDCREHFGVAIGANRGAGGYFLVSSSDEAAELAHQLFDQAFSLLAVARAVGSHHQMREWFDQQRIHFKLDQEAA